MLLTPEETSQLLVTIGQIDERTRTIEKLLNGNGQPGLKQKVDVVEARLDKAHGMGAAGIWIGTSAVGLRLIEWITSLYRGQH